MVAALPSLDVPPRSAIVSVGGTVTRGGDAAPLGAAVGADGAADGITATSLTSSSAEQITRPPPPLVELLHWLIRTALADDVSPEAVHVSSTNVPPLAESLHCVIVAPVVVAGNGSHPTTRG